MRLFTHNFLQCHVRNCTKDSFPLLIKDAEIAVKAAEYNADFLALQMCKIDYEALKATLLQLNIQNDLPEEAPEAPYSDSFLRSLHHVLLEMTVINGSMVCKGCNHVFPIVNGIPNMLLHEDEI